MKTILSVNLVMAFALASAFANKALGQTVSVTPTLPPTPPSSESSSATPSSPSLTPAKASAKISDKKMPEKKWIVRGKSFSFWGIYGKGFPGNTYRGLASHMDLGWEFHRGPKLVWGLVYSTFSAEAKESVFFPSTGYSETRYHQVKTSYIGPTLRYSMGSNYWLKMAVAPSFTGSEIVRVDTDAPIPSSSLGAAVGYPMSTGFNLAMQWEKPGRPFSWGGEGGLTITSMGKPEAFTELYIALLARWNPPTTSDTITYVPAPRPKSSPAPTPVPAPTPELTPTSTPVATPP